MRIGRGKAMQGFHGNRAGRVSIRVHFNQLALFTDHPVESTAEEAQRRSPMKETIFRTALGEAILKHWRENCPQMVRDLEKQHRLEQAVFEAQEKTGDLLYELVSVRKMNYQAAWELAAQEWALPQSEVLPPPSSARHPGSRATGEIQASDIEPEAAPASPPRDFRITEAHRIGQGGLKEKARDNIAAIRTLRLVEDESREGTQAEKAVLARYSGWGALSNVFHPYPRSDWQEIARDVRQNLELRRI